MTRLSSEQRRAFRWPKRVGRCASPPRDEPRMITRGVPSRPYMKKCHELGGASSSLLTNSPPTCPWLLLPASLALRARIDDETDDQKNTDPNHLYAPRACVVSLASPLGSLRCSPAADPA